MRSIVILGLALAACGEGGVHEGACQIADSAVPPDSLHTITCKADFAALASLPLDTTLPGARSAKVIVDRADSDTLYVQDSVEFSIHYAFASTHLSGGDLPIVGSLADFNSEQYFMPDRRFLLGAITYYEQPDVWALELAAYDTMSAEMLETLFRAVKDATYFGRVLAYHPTSEAQEQAAAALPDWIPVVTTDDIYAGIDYQPLSLGTGIGRLHFTTADALATEYVSYQDLVVLDSAPNDIAVVQGVITETFQTPLSHINVLARNRGMPNMGLRGALGDPRLAQYAEQLVKLTVLADTWTIEPATQAEAEQWWADHAPEPPELQPLDLSKTELLDIEDVTPEPATGESLRDAIRAAIPAYGGKAAHYSILRRTANVPIKKAFAIPVFYYHQFMTDNGFYDRVTQLLADPQFTTDPATRDAALAQLRTDIIAAPLDPAFLAAVQAKLAAYTDGPEIRFRSSSNSEDLDGFPCAGCYESHTGTIADVASFGDAIKKAYADVWSFRTFEIRAYYQVPHDAVGMALLAHHNFPDEEANGVAITANPFDASGLDPAFYINVQTGGDYEVVAPPPGVNSDQILYYFDQQNQPAVYIAHSNLIAPGTTVLSTAELHEFGTALAAIRDRFSPAYGPASGNTGWYALEVDFKLDDGAIFVKQARPYPDPWKSTQ